jgi:hypothetical protein
MTPYFASMVRRWHTNEHMNNTFDPLGYHGGRMAILALMLWPKPDARLLAQCVTHDLGEYVTGDIPWNAPNKDNDAETKARDGMGMDYCDSDPRVKFLDMLDAYLWARHHRPDIVKNDADWVDQRQKIIDQAFMFGVSLDQFRL